MKILDYLYYKLYKANLKGSLNDIAEWAAMIHLSGLLFANLFVIGGFLKKLGLLPLFFSSKNQIIIFIISLFVFDYFFFIKGKRYKQIITTYENESEKDRRKGIKNSNKRWRIKPTINPTL